MDVQLHDVCYLFLQAVEIMGRGFDILKITSIIIYSKYNTLILRLILFLAYLYENLAEFVESHVASLELRVASGHPIALQSIHHSLS